MTKRPMFGQKAWLILTQVLEMFSVRTEPAQCKISCDEQKLKHTPCREQGRHFHLRWMALNF